MENYIIIKVNKCIAGALVILMFQACQFKNDGKHLFILSGQSNMVRLKPEENLIPRLEQEFGKENIILVKYAKGSQPIRHWYADWKPAEGNIPNANPYLYDSLMQKVNKAIEYEKLASVNFLWMQGERDAREEHGGGYKRSLIGLYMQLCGDLGRKDINFIIGRLNDFDMSNDKWPHWTMIRDIQVEVAESNPRFDWVNTDDLNDGRNNQGNIIKNDLHMSERGYEVLGNRFADSAIRLIDLHK